MVSYEADRGTPNRRTRGSFRLRVAVVLVAVFASAAARAGVVLQCEQKVGSDRGAVVLTYEGDKSGTLKVKAPFGEFALPAQLEIREAQSEGKTLKATTIRALGSALVTMPDQAKLEACIAKRTTPDQAGDADFFYTYLEACRAETPPAAAPASVKTSINIGIFPDAAPEQPPMIIVEVRRTYPDHSTAPGGTLNIEAFPPPDCTLAK